MAKLSDAWLDELRARSDLVSVVSEYVPLKQKGRRFWGCCPFHGEKTPSFSVDMDQQMYYCFGCHKGGTVITFVREMERMEFMEAVKYLAERAHMEVPDTGGPSQPKTDNTERERIYEANRLAARFFHALLWKEEGAEALTYFRKRGLTDSDLRHFGLGAAPKGWDTLTKYLVGQGYSEALLEKAGLTKRKDARVYDMFRNRAMFSIINQHGNVIGFGGRVMDKGEPKYLNTSDTPVFNKRQGLYAMNWAKTERSLGHFVLVEGYMDTVSLRRNGVQGVVATLGTALTEEQAKLIKRFVPEVWISYDGDSAGQKAALRALDIFEPHDIRARVIDYPQGMDPDDYVKAYGREGFESLRRFEATEYRMIRAWDGLDRTTQEGMTQYALRCCEILKKVKNPVEQENYLRKLSKETGYEKEILARQVGAMPVPRETQTFKPRKPREETPKQELPSKAECALVTMLARGLIDGSVVRVDDLSNALARTITQDLLSGKSIYEIVENCRENGSETVAMQTIHYEPIPEERDEVLRYAGSCIAELRRTRLTARAEQIQKDIRTAAPEEKRRLYEQLARISEEMDIGGKKES